MTTRHEIELVVEEVGSLCENNNFKQAGELARKNKPKFIAMIKGGGIDELMYAYKVCTIFNMTQTDCFNLF